MKNQKVLLVFLLDLLDSDSMTIIMLAIPIITELNFPYLCYYHI